MAKFQPSLGNITGKLGGVVFQKGRGNQIIRSWVRNVDPRTPAQAFSRIRLSQASRNWHNLTDTQKANWETYAETFYSPRDGRPPGAVYTGHMAYVGARTLALSAVNSAATFVQVEHPPGTTIQLTEQNIPLYAPMHAFTATWKIDFQPRTIQMIEAFYTPGQQLGIVLTWEGQHVTNNTPITIDDGCGERWGIVVLASLNSRQAHGAQPRPRSFVACACPPIVDFQNWQGSDRVALVMNPRPQNMNRLRYIPLQGGAIRLTAVAITQNTAQAKIIGEVVV